MDSGGRGGLFSNNFHGGRLQHVGSGSGPGLVASSAGGFPQNGYLQQQQSQAAHYQLNADRDAFGLGGGSLVGGPGIGIEVGDLSMLGDGGGMSGMGGLGMDMGLPMDLDMDLSSAGTDGYGGGGMPAGLQQSAGYGLPAPQSGSTLTEFTKRRNWSQRIIEELKDFLHILTPDGRILYVSPSCRAITGYESNALVGKFIGEYVHPDDSGIFMREFNESIASGNSLRFFYRFKKDDGTYMILECDGHPHISVERPTEPQGYNASHQNGSQAGGMCRGFFMMARPYPTKNAALLDSFLEHKMENERLMKRIEELRREELEEVEENPDQAISISPSESSPRAGNGVSSESPAVAINYQGMPPPAKPPALNTALTRQNLDNVLSAQKQDSMADKMSRYEANSTHLESIELMTGLRYRDGERSHGISTGDASPALIRGDAGIAILADRDREAGKKERKKLKVADEYVCAICGTLDSPEWRKGPRGPKTLCNACGLRWAKKEKKRGGPEEGKGESSPVGMLAMGQLEGAMLPGLVCPRRR
ncbi:white collar 2 type of transcription factor [Friedmanniomyces endolithicus]|nr:white collar 2 type of transcription factor [Friedmanniomyces endolithicus]KAK0799433.1 white collar 2 type of transcription factor [Friedmanniomyces endolithicus]KAK0809519.1 white collar 2 type of transcription factor [Friedmanniomyces endolithicus]